MRVIEGKIFGLQSPIIGKITFNPFAIGKNKIFVGKKLPLRIFGFRCAVSSDIVYDQKQAVFNCDSKDIKILSEGDIVRIDTSGILQVLWEVNSSQNVLFTTDFCNSNCIMCPQLSSDNQRNYYEWK